MGGAHRAPPFFYNTLALSTLEGVAFFINPRYTPSPMTEDEAILVLRSLLAEQGTAPSPEADVAELVRLALCMDILPDAADRALAEVFDAASLAAGDTPEVHQ